MISLHDWVFILKDFASGSSKCPFKSKVTRTCSRTGFIVLKSLFLAAFEAILVEPEFLQQLVISERPYRCLLRVHGFKYMHYLVYRDSNVLNLGFFLQLRVYFDVF